MAPLIQPTRLRTTGVGGSYRSNTEFQNTSGSQMDYVCIGIGAGSEDRKTTRFSFCVIGGVSVDW